MLLLFLGNFGCKSGEPMACDTQCTPPRCKYDLGTNTCFRGCKSDDECAEDEACLCADKEKCFFDTVVDEMPGRRSDVCIHFTGPTRTERKKLGMRRSARFVDGGVNGFGETVKSN
jgi:hypothetical protein